VIYAQFFADCSYIGENRDKEASTRKAQKASPGRQALRYSDGIESLWLHADAVGRCSC
jgi:hypothetical protein